MRYISVFIAASLSCSAVANTPSPKLNVQNLALQKSYLQTIDCRAPQMISSLVKNALSDVDNYAAKANKASVFEEIMIKNPPCIIQALNQLPAKSCIQFKENFIDETFFYPRDDIKSALATAKNYSKSCIAS